jgi:hypothetical protein
MFHSIKGKWKNKVLQDIKERICFEVVLTEYQLLAHSRSFSEACQINCQNVLVIFICFLFHPIQKMA